MPETYRFERRPHNTRTQHLQVFGPEGQLMSWEAVLLAWETSRAFCLEYGRELAALSEEAIFWEHPPIKQHDLHQPYECMLIHSPTLASVRANVEPFAQFFVGNSLVASFLNLGKDSQLVAPSPREHKQYPHLLAFLRTASEDQQYAFWRETAFQVRSRLSDQSLWLSTSGLGVYWLHVRLDGRPKYYQHQPFKDAGYYK